jgi:hypothetical protein
MEVVSCCSYGEGALEVVRLRGHAQYKPANGHHHQSKTYLLLGVGPAGDLDDHVQDGLLLVGVERDVVEGRDGHAILLDVDAVLKSVRSADLAGGVDARGVGHSLGHDCGDSCVLGGIGDGGGREVTP